MGQEILPPQRPQRQVARAEPARTADIPGVHHGGLVSRYFANANNNGQSSVNRSLTTRNLTEAELFRAQGEAADAYGNLHRRLAALAELPEILGHELQLRRLDREGALDQRIHDNKQAIRLHEMEALYSEADITRARTIATTATAALVDAEQQVQAQRDFGYFTHELAHKKKALELLDIQLNEAERRAMLKKNFIEEAETANADDIDDALYAYLEILNAKGLDPSRIEAAIRARKQK